MIAQLTLTSTIILYPRDWRVHQRLDAVIGQFVQAITNKSKPTTDNITSREDKLLLREFHKLIIGSGTFYRKATDGDVQRLQLVLASAFHEKKPRHVHTIT